MTLLDLAEAPLTRVEQLAAYFRARPGQWIDGERLEFAGKYAWRTRVSDCRKPPFNMRIDNRVRRVPGSGRKISEYRYTPTEVH